MFQVPDEVSFSIFLQLPMKLQKGRQIKFSFAHLQFLHDLVFDLQEQVAVSWSIEILQFCSCHCGINSLFWSRHHPQSFGSGIVTSSSASFHKYLAWRLARFVWSKRASSEGGNCLKSSMVEKANIFNLTVLKVSVMSFFYKSRMKLEPNGSLGRLFPLANLQV